MKFFTAILSALALALAFAISTTSAIPIDPRRHTSPLSIMERQGPALLYGEGAVFPFNWDVTHFLRESQEKYGNIFLVNLGGAIIPSKLFSLPPRAPVASTSFFHPWLNWENLICVRPPHVDELGENVLLFQGQEQVTLPTDAPARDDYVLCSKSPSCGLGSIP